MAEAGSPPPDHAARPGDGVGSSSLTLSIDAREFRTRHQHAQRRAAEAGYDALLVIGRSFYDRPGDLAYLSNHFPPFPTAVPDATARGFGHGLLLLPASGAPTLLTDPRGHRTDLVAVADVRRHPDLARGTVDVLRENGLARSRVGLVGDDIWPASFDRLVTRELPGLRLDFEPDLIAGMRRIKSPAEQALLRAAALCADAGLSAAAAAVAAGGGSERTVAAAGTAAALAAGADFVRYFRVHSGTWSAAGSRWPPATDRPIVQGDVVAVDVIGARAGYGFDVNRVLIAPPLGTEHRDLLETVVTATERAVAACVAGATVDDVVRAASRVTAASRFADDAGPMAGHGIGLETVELPYLRAGDHTPLEPGMALCVEPGIFVPGWAGAAVEQEVIIRADGPPEVITPTPTRFW